MEWLVPVCLFWVLTAIYLGGCPVEVVGGNGFRQVMGVVEIEVEGVGVLRNTLVPAGSS